MKRSVLGRYALNCCAAAAMLAGCGGSQPPIGALGAMPQGAPSLPAPFAAQGLFARPRAVPQILAPKPLWMKGGNRSDDGYVYVGQWWSKYVAAYRPNNRRNAKPLCETGPVYASEGMATDASGNLYVANEDEVVGVTAFGPNCGKPGNTYYYDVGGWPQDPVVDGKTLYVTSIDDSPYSATIGVFNVAGGQHAQFNNPTNALGIGLAVDSHHNLFWSTNNSWNSGGQVIEFRSGKMPGYLLKATEIGTDYPGGVLVDKSNNLLFIDQTTSSINIYAPPYARPPTAKISLQGAAEYCALNPAQSLIYCMDSAYNSVDVYTYPKGNYLYSFTNGLEGSQGPVGIAIQPPITGSPARGDPRSQSSLLAGPHSVQQQEHSWMSSRANFEDLLYISDEGTNDVYAFSWPKGELMGKIAGALVSPR